jgi:monoamine oxidase
MSSDFDAAVVGAGAAGLAAGRRLVERGAAVVVLEARDRVGGRAWTVPTRIGRPLDLGCEWLHSADRNPWTAQARALGFALDERLPDWSTRIRRSGASAAEQDDWLAVRTAFYEAVERAAAAGPDRPAATLLPPGGRWNAMLDAISTWANGVELARVSIHDLARYDDSGINWRTLDGYGTLIARYGAGVPVRLASAVRRIDHRGAAIALETARGTLRARAVIVTVPTPLIGSGALAFVPALPAKQAAAAGLPLGLANKLFLEIVDGGADLPTDTHLIGAADRTATASYQLRPHGWPVIQAYFGGTFARELERAGPDAFVAVALDELAGLLGGAIRARLRLLAASAWDGDEFARGGYSYALPGHADDRAVLAAPVDDRLFFAGEACSPYDFSTAHGAYLTGVAAADQALAALGRSR